MSSSFKSQNQDSGTRILVKILYWITVIVGLWFAFLNLQPYAEAVKAVMANSTIDSTLIKLIAAIPIVNGIAAIIGTALHWVVGTLIWLVIQTVEVFPIILRRDRAFMKVLINQAQSSQKFAVRQNDDPALATLKRWYNSFPTLTMTNARNLALFTYAIDFLICTIVYPPCSGGFGQLMFILMSGQWSQLDWGNIALLTITLFAIETIIRFLFWLGQIAYFMKAAHYK